jgi:bifunctional polynucleotide phosphatase/kinase
MTITISLKWNQHSTCYYSISDYNKRSKYALFDLDGTLLITNKMELKFQQVRERLTELINTCDTRIVIVSNQYGICRGHTNHAAFRNRIRSLRKKLYPISVDVYYAIERDSYRKPMTDQIKLMFSLTGRGGILFYCGDAAGRKGDFAISDRYFAHNINMLLGTNTVQFKTPEEFFAGASPQKVTKHDVYCDWNPTEADIIDTTTSTITSNSSNSTNNDSNSSTQNLILMVGPQAAGKTLLSTTIFANYQHLSLDILKNRKTLANKFQQTLSTGENIIIDNTNGCLADRNFYVEYARDAGYHTCIIFFNYSKQLCFHLNSLRAQMNHTGLKVPAVAIHTYYKRLEIPTEDECDSLMIVDKILLPINIDRKSQLKFRRYYQYHYTQ